MLNSVGNSHRTSQHNIVISPCSEISFISEHVVRLLNLRRQHSLLSIIGIGGSKTSQTRGSASLCLKSLTSSESISLTAHILPTLTTRLPTFQAGDQVWPHLRNLKLADPDFLTPRAIDLIIGADAYGQLIKPNLIKGEPTMPIAQFSIFGWLILGPVTSSRSFKAAYHLAIQQHDDSLQQLLTKFWVQEETPQVTDHQLTPEEQECENHFKATHTRDADGRYVVRLPLNSSPSRLGNSLLTARRCLQAMLRRLNKNETLKELYLKFMREYEQLGHMQKALSSSSSQPQYYLPHHGVLRPDSTSTKLRVVFNGSSSTSSSVSLNDLMHTGANLHLEISDVLIWIRQYRHIFATDVTKMYRQIKVDKRDWDLQRILWVDENGQEISYHLTTVTYGTRSAPFLAVRALLQLAEDEGHKYPLAIPSITSGRYVDDIFGGADTVEHLIEIAHQLKDLCDAGGFPLAKWFATHSDLLTSINTEINSSTEISFDDCETKILGLKWKPQQDIFTFSTKAPTLPRTISKRIILSEVAQIYDPLGFSSPVVVKAKMLLQELWLHKLKWDDPLPSQLISRWLTLREDLTSLARLSIPRWFNTWENSTVELHGFSDASQLAMAAVIYITVKSSSTEISSSFVCAKSKVAPLKRLTIPRLELSAALLLTKLMKYVQATLKVDIQATHLWTDSQVTLAWIRSHPSRWKEFVRNRVTQIHEYSGNAQWRHVPGTSNPADCASRGISTDNLKDHSLWWNGPPWMSQPEEKWPSQPTDIQTEVESRPGVSLVVTINKDHYHWDLIFRYSSLTKLLRLTALCFRILSKAKGIPINLPISKIEVSDLENSKKFWVKATQLVHYSDELKTLQSEATLPNTHVFSRLTAFVDTEGVIRVGGRLELTDLPFESKHPAILPRRSQLTSLVIDQAHRQTFHGGTQQTLAHIRLAYWIIGGRASVKSHVLKCVVCARQRGIRAHQLMGQLPLCRITPSRAFYHTGVDYAGPLTLKTWKGRGAKTVKGWICLFVCFSTSAVHLEIATDYSSEGFIAIFRRFSSRRGLPHSMYSDCGTNFKGAHKDLQQLFSLSSKEHSQISSTLAKDRVQWVFNPPAAPHMGGKWEAVVKSIKFHIRRTIGETVLTYEEFSTLLTQIEGLLNSRPLEPLTDDPDDLAALTPGHFLIGSALTAHPEPSLREVPMTRLSRWQLIQQKTQQFWSQWATQYLQRQLSISKWYHPNNHVNIGALVLITDERLPPSKWPLARIIDVHKGADGLIRVVTLKTATTTLIRPLTKLAILPVHSSDQETTSHQPTG